MNSIGNYINPKCLSERFDFVVELDINNAAEFNENAAEESGSFFDDKSIQNIFLFNLSK